MRDMEQMKAYRALWTYRRKREGYCSRCYCKPAVFGYALCAECREPKKPPR